MSMRHVDFIGDSVLFGSLYMLFTPSTGEIDVFFNDEEKTKLCTIGGVMGWDDDDDNVKIIQSRVYEALNGHHKDHASELVCQFLDTGDPFFNVRRS